MNSLVDTVNAARKGAFLPSPPRRPVGDVVEVPHKADCFKVGGPVHYSFTMGGGVEVVAQPGEVMLRVRRTVCACGQKTETVIGHVWPKELRPKVTPAVAKVILRAGATGGADMSQKELDQLRRQADTSDRLRREQADKLDRLRHEQQWRGEHSNPYDHSGR